MTDQTTEIAVGDLVQISPGIEEMMAVFAGCIAIVDTIESFGVTAYIVIPRQRNSGSAYVRLRREDCVRVGRSKWHVKDIAGDWVETP